MNHEGDRRGEEAAASTQRGAAPRATGPRRVRGGIRLTAEVEDLRRDLRALPWLGHAERLGDPETFDLGLQYAQIGQGVSLHVGPGHVTADIQGARRTPYRVVINVEEWTEAERERAAAIIAGEAALFAELLVGEVSQRLVAALGRGGLQPGPSWDAPVRARCACSREERCKHIAAAMILVAEKSIVDPSSALLLRGVSIEWLVDRIQQQRGIEARGEVPAHPEPAIDALALASPPLEESIESFWNFAGEPPELVRCDARHHAAHALLRRLGPSPLPGRFPIMGLLASIYDEVSTRARAMLDE